ncbi:MAG TPA: DUF2325 domain-containing protein [Polyangiaceae bacterium]|nr:DUF2325 domain-containing protein [Polyangiaceae bacterium]
MSHRPRVSFIGGAERMEPDLLALGDELGIDVEFHGGHTRGTGAARLASLVQRTNLLVIITGTNSHNAVHVAKREASRHGIPMRILRACGVGTARALLAEVARAAGF